MILRLRKLSFHPQLHLCIALIFAGFALTAITRISIFSNLGWILSGILFLRNPVYPEFFLNFPPKKRVRIIHIIADVLIVLGCLVYYV